MDCPILRTVFYHKCSIYYSYELPFHFLRIWRFTRSTLLKSLVSTNLATACGIHPIDKNSTFSVLFFLPFLELIIYFSSHNLHLS
jgi:hypothetical protein